MKHCCHLWALAASGLCLLAACGRDASPEERVHSHLEGRITVHAEVDSIPDYRGFEVLVAYSEAGDPDTLGYAVTDSTGWFSMEVAAPDRGIYPLLISRRGTVLKVDELVVAEGDSALLNVAFPVGSRPLRVRSKENAAWTAYKNTKAQYNQSILRLVQQGPYDEAAVQQSVAQTASILWSMRDNYANTIGGELAAAESVLMLGSAHDSLLIARAREVEPENPNFAEVARAARRAQTRLAGAEAGRALLQTFMDRTDDPESLAALHSEQVLSYLDDGQIEEAGQAARALAEQYPGTQWARWAEQILYDFEHLMPGMEAPAFTATTHDGETLRLDSLRGQLVLLEFYSPLDRVYQREIEARDALYALAGEAPFTIVSVSVLPDTLLNEAFLEGRNLAGYHIFAPGGPEGDLARQYNVHHLPRRFLIDAEGRIISKHEGTSITTLQQELAALLREEDPPS